MGDYNQFFYSIFFLLVCCFISFYLNVVCVYIYRKRGIVGETIGER